MAAVLAALIVVHLHAASADFSPDATPTPGADTISLEAESALPGGAVRVLSGPLASGGRFVHFRGPASPPPAGGVRVAGNRLLRDGAPFMPVGFTMVALVHPTAGGETAHAARRLNDRSMEAAKAWGANTIRFQVSQRGLDPQDTLYSQAYVDRIVAGVALARRHGFVVILSIQDQGPSGGDSHAQPSPATIRDWQTLAPLFNGDQHVVYEIFNEPQNKPTADGWDVWRNGGPPERNQGTPAVGHQRVLEAIRATGATNVVIADGAQFAQRLDGVPLLHDPLGQVAYGVHPYLTHSLREPEDWRPGFGFLSTQYPVVATEWTAVSRVQFCKPEWGTTAPQMVDFLQRRGIGMLAWAFDVLDTLILDWQHYTPTSLAGFQCGDGFDHGAGELIKAEMPGWQPLAAPCATGRSDEGALAVPVDVPRDGTYRLWSRVLPSKQGTLGSQLQVDAECPVMAWEGLEPDDGWSWRAAAQPLTLKAGRHTLRFLGAEGGANLDRVLLTTDTVCDPADPAKPCPAPTTTTTTKPKPTTTTAGPTTTTHRSPRPPTDRPDRPRPRPHVRSAR